METKVEQRNMELIALAFSCLIGDVGIHPSEWEDQDRTIPDLTIGNHNDWWLRHIPFDPDGDDLYLQARHGDFLKHNCIPSRGTPSNAVIGYRMIRLCKEIEKHLEVKIRLPFSFEEVQEAMRTERTW